MALSLRSKTFVVTDIRHGGLQRIGYAIGNPEDPTFAVYAERAIPANRRAPVESDSAFADLNYATYLGPTTPVRPDHHGPRRTTNSRSPVTRPAK